MRNNTQAFTKQATKIHSEKYRYNLVDYILNNIPVKIFCFRHGIFEQTPNSHLAGKGCPACAKIALSERNKRRTPDLIGKRFGKWTVIKSMVVKKRTRWLCRCDCSQLGQVATSNLVQALSTNCGCDRKEPYKHLYSKLKDTAIRFGRDSNLLSFNDFTEFISESKCHYCNYQIHWTKYYTENKKCYNLDRKDNNRGYDKENCVVSCWECNMVKGNLLTYEEMRTVGPVVRAALNRRVSLTSSEISPQ